mmetsp:Transcript_44745/g.127742  ORF Transcript_44745/g.127742 Transcript_44745/m.127742 type:complete len:268 (-) Transcript_44745:588-1391(-)
MNIVRRLALLCQILLPQPEVHGSSRARVKRCLYVFHTFNPSPVDGKKGTPGIHLLAADGKATCDLQLVREQRQSGRHVCRRGAAGDPQGLGRVPQPKPAAVRLGARGGDPGAAAADLRPAPARAAVLGPPRQVEVAAEQHALARAPERAHARAQELEEAPLLGNHGLPRLACSLGVDMGRVRIQHGNAPQVDEQAPALLVQRIAEHLLRRTHSAQRRHILPDPCGHAVVSRLLALELVESPEAPVALKHSSTLGCIALILDPTREDL